MPSNSKYCARVFVTGWIYLQLAQNKCARWRHTPHDQQGDDGDDDDEDDGDDDDDDDDDDDGEGDVGCVFPGVIRVDWCREWGADADVLHLSTQ